MGRTPLDLVSNMHKEQLLQINPKEPPVYNPNLVDSSYLLRDYQRYQARKITGVVSDDSEDD